MEKIDLKKLEEIWSPFNATVWIKLNTPVTKEEVAQAIAENKLISPETPKKMFMDFWDESSREEHVQRIAWLVKNFSDEYPIELDFGIPGFGGMCGFDIYDGNHRLAAAIYLERPYITANCSGAESLIDKFLLK